ncbi:ABC transporter substrate-binding protein [Cumulibacter soli]|uniref:ABC transporter substrate-binding protein n=1 Tax=Cumulibacter soli TaxID=2546344 RepID=UPI0010685EAD|nr:ABC transporter substrate-binding protein [Cumulibacter soli]
MRLRISAVALVMLLTACGGGTSDDAAEAAPVDPNGELVYLDASGNLDLDPAGSQNDSSFAQTGLYAIYERLLTMTPEGELEPGLATEWGFVNDELTEFELTLRDGVTFHDGAEFNADAVVKNIERSQNHPAPGIAVKDGAENIAKVEAQDEMTVLITLKEPDSGLAFRLATQLGMMISPDAIDGSTGVDLDPVGAGPYMVDSYEPNDETVMSRFDDFWDGPGDRPAKFTARYVADDQTRLNSLRSGEANLALVSPRQVTEAENSGLEVTVNPTSSEWVMYLNTSGPLKDLKVRQAVSYALDREGLAEALSFGTAEPVVQVFPGDSPYSSPDAVDYPHDPDKAKELLAEAGTPEVTLSWLLLNTPEYLQLAEAIQAQLADVGITVEFETVDVSQIGLYTSGEVGDVMMARWGGRADPLQTLEVLVGENASYAPAGVISPDLADKIVEIQGIADSDAEARTTAVQEASALTTELVATLPVITRANIYAAEPGCVLNVNPYLGSGAPDLRDVTVGEGCSPS